MTTDSEPTVSPEPPPVRRGRSWRRLTPPSRRTVAGLVVVLAAFVTLAVLVALRWSPLIRGDQAGELAAHRDVLAYPWLLAGAGVVTTIGSPLAVNVVTVVVGLILLVGRRVRAVLFLVVVRVVELGVETGVKQMVHRSRPIWPDPVAHASGFSFPSGHAGGSAAVYGALLVLALAATRRPARPAARIAVAVLGVLVVVLVAAVAASRVLLGVHYPSDVTAGILLGVICLLAARPLQQPPPPVPRFSSTSADLSY
jgi:membrane-associated phospholipid phosphatase